MALYKGYNKGVNKVDPSIGSVFDKDGFTMKGDIEMDGNEVKGLGAPTDDTSATTKKWVDDEIIKRAALTIQPSGFTMTGEINMGNNKITNLKSTGGDFSEAANVQYVHTYTWNNYLATNGFSKMRGVLNAGGFEIQGLTTTASKDDSAVSRFYLHQWVNGRFLPLDGSVSMSGDLDMSTGEVKALGDPTTGKSAVHKDWVIGMLNRPVSGLNIKGDIDMKDYEIKGLKDPTTNQSAVTKKWAVDNNFLYKGGRMLADISMAGYRLFGLRDPKIDNEAAPKKWVEDKLLTIPSTSGFTMSGNLLMGGHEIKNLGNPTSDTSAVSKRWVTSGFTLNGDLTVANGSSIYTTNNLGGKIAIPNIQTVVNQISRFALKLDGSGEMTGVLKMGGNEIENIGAPSADGSAVNKKWVEDKISGGRRKRETYSGLTLSDNLDMGNNEIIKLGAPTTDNSAVSKKWVTNHVSGSTLGSGGFTMSGNIDMSGNTITGLSSGSSGASSAVSYGSMTNWCSQFLKRGGGVLSGNLDVNDYELTRVGDPTTGKSAVNRDWATNEFMSSRGGLVKGDLDMGDSSGILDLKDPVNNKDAVNKQWVEMNFLKPSTGLTQATADLRYVRLLRHIHAEWIWGYRGVAVAATRYYAYCHDQIPPSWRTDPINNMADLNLESITIKSDFPRFSTVLNIPIALILWATVWEKQSNGKFTQVKKEIALRTIDLRRLSHTWFNGTYTTTGGSTACYVFKGNSMFYLGAQAELVDNTLAWCIIVKPEHSMPTGSSMDMSFCWSLRYSGSGA